MISEVIINRRIIFADTDAGGMMYFGHAARWVETGINEWFRENNFSFLKDKSLNLFWVVRELRTLYSKPIVYDEEIQIASTLRAIQRFSLIFDVVVMGAENSKKFSSFVRLVSVDKTSQIPQPIPNQIFLKRKLINKGIKIESSTN